MRCVSWSRGSKQNPRISNMFKRVMKRISDAWINWLNHEKPHDGVPLCDFERIRYELRIGDVLLIEGRSRISDIIRSMTQSSWSHSALYIGRLHDIEDPKTRNLISSHFKGTPDTQLLVEGIMGKGAIINPLSVYEHDHIRVCRPRGLSRQDAQQVINHAIAKLGTEYDVRQVMDLARFMFPWRLFPRQMGSKLFLDNNSEHAKVVCSTMIAEAFASVDFPILPFVKKHTTKGVELIARNTKLYTPRDFDYSPYFDIMKYPFLETANHAPYRKLPWNREGLVSHDRVGIHASKAKTNAQISAKTQEDSALEITFEEAMHEMEAELETIDNDTDTVTDPNTVTETDADISADTLDAYFNAIAPADHNADHNQPEHEGSVRRTKKTQPRPQESATSKDNEETARNRHTSKKKSKKSPINPS